MHDFLRKVLFFLCSINWPNFIVCLPILLELLGNMCIGMVCSSGYDVINFEINLAFVFMSTAKIAENITNTLNYSFSTACYYHVTYVFQSKSTFYSCLSFEQFLARNRRDIWSLSDSNEIGIHHHLVCKGTFN